VAGTLSTFRSLPDHIKAGLDLVLEILYVQDVFEFTSFLVILYKTMKNGTRQIFFENSNWLPRLFGP